MISDKSLFITRINSVAGLGVQNNNLGSKQSWQQNEQIKMMPKISHLLIPGAKCKLRNRGRAPGDWPDFLINYKQTGPGQTFPQWCVPRWSSKHREFLLPSGIPNPKRKTRMMNQAKHFLSTPPIYQSALSPQGEVRRVRRSRRIPYQPTVPFFLLKLYQILCSVT